MTRKMNMNDVIDVVVDAFQYAQKPLCNPFTMTPIVGTCRDMEMVYILSDLLPRLYSEVFKTPEDFYNYVSIQLDRTYRDYRAVIEGDPLKDILRRRTDAYRNIWDAVREEEKLITEGVRP